jgi:hypothetical protein
MATRYRVGILQEDGAIKSVYGHWDGYPESAGKILTEKFNTKEKVEDLIEGGDISCLETDTDWKGNRRESTFVLYYKDRGDLDCGSLTSEDDFNYFQLTRNCDGEFAYLFDPGAQTWECFNMHSAVSVPIPTDS